MKNIFLFISILLLPLVLYTQTKEFNLIDTDKDGVKDKFDKCPSVKGLGYYDGCPKPKEIICITPVAVGPIYFEKRSTRFSKENIKELNKMVSLMKEYTKESFLIEGHTDNVEKPRRKQVLSEKRAMKLMKYFVAKGIDKTRFFLKGYGDEYPIADNRTEKGRKLNRRAEIRVNK